MRFRMMNVKTVCFLALLLFSACEDKAELPSAAGPLASRLVGAAGDVFIVQGKNETALSAGAFLEDGTRIRVGKQARALVHQGNGVEIAVRENSEVILTDGFVSLLSGEIFADTALADEKVRFVAAKHTITAKDAALDIAIGNQALHTVVFRGPVVLDTRKEQEEIQTGEQCTVSAAAIADVTPTSRFVDWTGGMADRGSRAGDMVGAGRLLGINPRIENTPPVPLEISFMTVSVTISDGIARTTVDQRFFNPTRQAMEGWYWFKVPEDAAVDRFAVEMNDLLVDGEIVERAAATDAYEASIRAASDPALLEWVDGRSYRARIYPLPAAGTRRVVVSYIERLPLLDGVYRYVYPMGSGRTPEIAEFSLTVDLGEEGRDAVLSTTKEARIESRGNRVSLRRSAFVPRQDFLLEIRPKVSPSPLRVSRAQGQGAEADYVMLRYAPEAGRRAARHSGTAVTVVLDTSAGGDDADRQLRIDTLTALLSALGPSDRFAVVATDVGTRSIYPKSGFMPAYPHYISTAVDALSKVPFGGATDLGEMFGAAAGGKAPVAVYIGDGRATVGEVTNEEVLERFKQSFGDSKTRFFSVAVGHEANLGLLAALAREGGGDAFRIDTEEDIPKSAAQLVDAMKTPVIADLAIQAGEGLDQVFAADRILRRGDEAVVLARTHHPLPEEIRVTGRVGTQTFAETFFLSRAKIAEQESVRILWAGRKLRNLIEDGEDENQGALTSLGLQYELLTPFTSFLVLENESEYAARGIQRRRGPKKEMNTGTAQNTSDRVLRHSGAEGQIGSRQSADRNKHNGIKGPPDEPHMARSQAKDGNVLGYLSASGASSSPFGPETALGIDPENAYGALMGNPIGEGFGFGGLGLRGTGRGGGDVGRENIGLGSLNSIGSGAAFIGRNRTADRTGKPSVFARKEHSAIVEGESSSAEAPRRNPRICSDASTRPLYEREAIWRRRIGLEFSAERAARVFDNAQDRCELKGQRDVKILLDIIASNSEQTENAASLLDAFSHRAGARAHLRHLILRRAFRADAFLSEELTEPEVRAVARGLSIMKSDDTRIAALRELLESHPGDEAVSTLLVEALARAGNRKEAASLARKFRREGNTTARLLTLLCDLTADSENGPQAARTCSELAELTENNAEAALYLGNIYLRRGWYQAAYRQFKTEVHRSGSPLSRLKLAQSAAALGRADEAERVAKKSIVQQLEIGNDAARQWAELLQAALFAEALTKVDKDRTTQNALTRALRQNPMISPNDTVRILSWKDEDALLQLTAEKEKQPFQVARTVSAPPLGLFLQAALLDDTHRTLVVPTADTEALRRDVPYRLYTIRLTDNGVHIQKTDGILKAGEKQTPVNAV